MQQVLDNILQCLVENIFVVAMFMDTAKAFDTTIHDIFITK